MPDFNQFTTTQNSPAPTSSKNVLSNFITILFKKVLDKIKNDYSKIGYETEPINTAGQKQLIHDDKLVESNEEQQKEKIKKLYDEVHELETVLKDKSPQFIEGFLNEYKNGPNDIAKPIQKELDEINKEALSEIDKTESLALISNTEELANQIENQQKTLKDLNNDIDSDSLDNLDWEENMENDFYHNTISLENINKTRLQIIQAIEIDSNTIKPFKINVDISNFNAEIKEINGQLKTFRDDLNKGSKINDHDKDRLKETVERLNVIKSKITIHEKEYKKQITDLLKKETESIINKPPKLKSETGKKLLNALKSLEKYNEFYENVSKDLKIDKNYAGKHDLAQYLMNDKKHIGANKSRIQFSNIKEIHNNLEKAKAELKTKLQGSKTLLGKGNKNQPVKEKARALFANLEAISENAKTTHQALDVITSNSVRPWIVPEKQGNNLDKFKDQVAKISNDVEDKANDVINKLDDDIKKTALAVNNMQTRSYEDNALSINRILIEGTSALEDIKKLKSHLEVIDGQINVEASVVSNDLNKVEAYFGLAEATANTLESAVQLTTKAVGVTVPSGSSTKQDGKELTQTHSETSIGIPNSKINGITGGIRNLSTLGSKQYLNDIKIIINNSKKKIEEKEKQLQRVLDTAKTAQEKIVGKEEVFLPQLDAEKFRNKNKSTGYKDEMYGAFAAKQFKNKDGASSTTSKLQRDNLRFEGDLHKAKAEFLKCAIRR